MMENNKKSAILNIWIVEIKPGAEMQLGKEGAALWYSISKLPGFVSYKWFQSVENPLQMVTISEWETVEDLKRFKEIIEDIYGSRKQDVFKGEPLSFDLIEVGEKEYWSKKYEKNFKESK